MGKKGVRPSAKAAAFGGVGAGLIVVLLLGSSLLPFLEYTIPAACALVIYFISMECSRQAAMLSYAASALLSVLLIPNKEAAILYALFFGYYPVLHQLLLRYPKWLRWGVKFLVFNLTMIGSYAVLIFVFGLNELWEELSLGMQFGAVLLLLMGNFAFWLFDLLLVRAGELYQAKKMGMQITPNGYLANFIRRFQKK